MEFEGPKINKLYRQDTWLVFVFILFVWVVLGLVLVNVTSLAVNDVIRNVALFVGVVAGFFVTSALVAVLVHLKKNRIALYSEEIRNTTTGA